MIEKKTGITGSPVGYRNERQINRLERYRNVDKRNGKRRHVSKQHIDLDQVYRCARTMCSSAEIASILGIPGNLMQDWLTSWPDFADAIDKGYNETKENLRKTQLELALNGHPSMLMWLGKQYLGQADKHEQNTKTEINITVQRAMDELRNIPKDKLMQAMALIDAPVIDNN